MERLQGLEVERQQAPDQQLSLTGPDARSIATIDRTVVADRGYFDGAPLAVCARGAPPR
jgi:hypothetical protein